MWQSEETPAWEMLHVNSDATGRKRDGNADTSVPRCGTRDDRGGAGLLACHPVIGGRNKCASGQLVGGSASSRKVVEMRVAPLVTLAFQHPSGDRYIALGGRATITEDIAEMRTIWSSDMDAHFPPGFADANMIVIQVDVDRIEVHVRGLTPEPFGAGRTLPERQPAGSWRFVPAW